MKRSLVFTIALTVLCSCGKKELSPSSSGGITSTPLKTPSDGGEGSLFTSLAAEQTGIDFVNPIDNEHPMRRLYSSSMVVGGVAVGDVDGDGNPDLFFTGGPVGNRLYRQTKTFVFEDITAKAGVDGAGRWGVGTAIVDIDNDGDQDIYVCNHDAPNQLFINNGKGVFTEEAKAFGLDLKDASHTPAFADYDRDGRVDLFLLTNRYYHEKGKFPEDLAVATRDPRGNIIIKPEYERYVRITNIIENPGANPIVEWEDTGRPDHIYRNLGRGKFEDVTSNVGITSHGYGLSATWWDYNDDGYVDLYVGNDFDEPDYLYRNNGDGTFTNVIEDMVPHTSWFSMGADFGDLNRDGRMDFLIADMSGTTHYKQKTNMGAMGDSAEFLATAFPRQYMRNTLFLGTGQERFMEAAYITHLADSDWTWTVKISDFDNDGWEDVYFTNGMSKNFNESDNKTAIEIRNWETQWDRHVRAGTEELREQNLAFHNKGDLDFEDVSKEWGLDHVGMSFGSVHADLDRDGDLDLVTVNLSDPISVHRNDSTSGNRVLVSLEGSLSHPQGIGARLNLETNGHVQKRQVTLMRGYMGSHEPIIHFGLGNAEKIDRLTIDWPSGHRQEFTDLSVNQHHTVREPSSKAPSIPWKPTLPQPMFTEGSALAELKHVENEFDDFADQLLLPNKMSQFGPALAVGDVDGDGDEDLIMSGSVGKPAMLARNEAGTYALEPATPHEVQEDLGVLLFDSDGDSDLDLYVVSGGSEYKPDTQLAYLQDRLYLNDGKGKFTLAPTGHLPRVASSGGVVVAADFDRDGDLDLFVGGRTVPGDYPETPVSFLLQNEGGRFTDATASLAPGLSQTGLVTAGLFTDVDGDGWLDLMVTHEWGPLKYYRNQGGRFSDQTEAVGLDEWSGWWNSLAANDFDGDGDIDYVAMNYGLNTKYHASTEFPTLLYYGDFEGTGERKIVEAKFEDETLFPVRGRSCSSTEMPHLADKFETYRAFASASLVDIYPEEDLKQSIRLAATELSSGVFLNQDGKFEFVSLPRTVQTAPGYGVVTAEMDGDGISDLYMVQNSYAPQVETGHMAGGVSFFLRGLGDGTFEPVWPDTSGLLVPGDAKSLVITDLNKDGRPDFIVGVNDRAVQTFENQIEGRFFALALEGSPGNPHATGSRVTVETSDGKQQIAETYTGSGYLSQSSHTLYFGLSEGSAVSRVSVRTPTGEVKEFSGEAIEGTQVKLKL